MKVFDYSSLADRTWDNEIVSYLTQIHEYKGKQELYIRQKPVLLQILDEGKLHDRLGRVGDFSNALILFTSNIGSQFIVDAFNEGNIPQNNDLMDIMQGHFRGLYYWSR